MTFKFGASNQALTLKLGLSLFSPWSPSTGEAQDMVQTASLEVSAG